MHKILEFFFIISYKSFNNRQERCPEFQFFLYLYVKFSYIIGFGEYRVITKNAPFRSAFSAERLFHSAYLPKKCNSVSSLNALNTAKNAEYRGTKPPLVFMLTMSFFIFLYLSQPWSLQSPPPPPQPRTCHLPPDTWRCSVTMKCLNENLVAKYAADHL